MNAKETRFLLFLTAIWFVAILVLLMYFTSSRLSPFDPDNLLLDAASTLEYDREFADRLAQEIGEVSNRVVHFQAADCACNQIAKQHINSVAVLANQHQFQNTTLDLTPNTSRALRLPSAPAVAVFDKSGQLIYLGPYSGGYSCSAGNGIVEKYITESEHQHIAATILTEVQGCYCALY